MKRLKFLAGVLAITLLCGCGGGANSAVTPAPVPAEDDLAWQTVGIRRGDAIVTVDGEGVPAEEYLFWLSNAIETEQYYGGPVADEDWAGLGEELKADALETAKLYQVIRNKAAEYGAGLTPEQEEEVRSETEAVVEQSGGEEAFRARLDQMCISREGFLNLNLVYYLNENLREKLEEDGAIAVTDDELDEHIEENGIYAAKHILISTRRQLGDGSYEEFSDEERAEALKVARDLYDRLIASGNSEELFDALMKEYSGDGRDESGNLYAPEGYTYVYPGRMVSEFEEGAKALKIGEISQPIQTTFGYHIILRIPVDRAQAQAEYGADYKFSKLLDRWVDEAQVTTTKAYDELDPKSFYEKLTAVSGERAAAPEETDRAESIESAAP